ncbi:MAG: anthranilate phosphoribosyltransferase [Armatimonadetes bacterium]|nr:anthranilate phosphoribosyltransferase [Armatimonadota bacterium]
MIIDAIRKVTTGQDLTRVEAAAAMDEIMTGAATPVQVAALLTGLKMKGERVEEVTGFAETMRAHSLQARPTRTDLVDTCGTGGDGSGTFNISTAAAFVVAGAGLGVAKHGNRAMSSPCGSAVVLVALGVSIQMTPERAARAIDEIGVGFLFAQAFHPAMKHAAPVRREIGIRTVFNILGPLTNPAGARAQLLGVFHPALTDIMARVLANLGSQRAFVVHGHGSLDEIATTGPTLVSEVRDGEVRSYELDARDLGIPSPHPDALKGAGTPEGNAAILVRVLQREPGPRRDIVILNAAAALVAGGAAPDLPAGVAMARESIDSGAARGKLAALREFSPS